MRSLTIEPRLADLPAWWRSARGLESMGGELPAGIPATFHSDSMIRHYVSLSACKPWAWDGLVALLRALSGCEPVLLRAWACRVTRDGLTRPRQRGKANTDDRDAALQPLYRSLRSDGWTREGAIGEIAEITGLTDGQVDAGVRKAL